MQVQFYGRLGWRGWAIIIVGLATGIAISVAIAVVAVSAMLVLVPALALAAAISYLITRFRPRSSGPSPDDGARIIDGQFRVVERRDDRLRRTAADGDEE
jgi:hypothetical protein